MNRLFAVLALSSTLWGAVAVGADAPSTTKAPATSSNTTTAETSWRAKCVKQCNAAEAQCSSEVRRARQQCSKNAAHTGQDPMSPGADKYVYFCGYFRNPAACSPQRNPERCRLRYEQHLDVCIDLVEDNVAAMRHDCFLYEREARDLCREELRACEAQCGE